MRRISYIGAVAVGGLGLYFLALWVNNIAHRLTFPFPIEYLEDAIFFHALRVSEGLPLYMNPDDGFVAIIYTPGYFYLLAALFKIFGPSIALARFISLFCTFGIIGLLLKLSFHRMKFPLLIVPIGVYLSLLYGHFAGYQDVGRVDPLMILFVLAGLFLIGDGKGGLRKILPGVILLTLACYIKQPALAYLPFVYAFILSRDRKAGRIGVLVSLGMLFGIFFIANAATGGWFGFYTVKLPAAHRLYWESISIVLFGGEVHYGFRGILYLILATLIFIAFRSLTLKREPLNIIEVTLPGAVIATLGPFMKEGRYFQDLIPLYTHLCFLLPFALSLPLMLKGREDNHNFPHMNPAIPIITLVLAIHCAFAVSPWDEFPPKPDNTRLGWDYVEKIKGIDGDVLMPSLGYYGWLAGKEPGYVGVALTDLMVLGRRPEPLIEDVRAGRYSAICLPEYFEAENYWPYDLGEYGYSERFELIQSPMETYDLRKNIERPPNNCYLRIQPAGN